MYSQISKLPIRIETCECLLFLFPPCSSSLHFLADVEAGGHGGNEWASSEGRLTQSQEGPAQQLVVVGICNQREERLLLCFWFDESNHNGF